MSIPQYDPNYRSGVSDGESKNRTLWYVRWAVIAFVVLLLAALVQTLPTRPSTMTASMPMTTMMPTHASAEPQGSVMTQVRAAYGPWTLVANDSVSNHVVMLMQNGTKEEGSVVATTTTWKQVAVPVSLQITVSSQTAQVLADNETVYTLKLGQAFILENHPESIYAITTNNIVGSATERK